VRAQAAARGAARCESQLLGRGFRAVARGAVRCASQEFDRCAKAIARSAAQVNDRGAQAVASLCVAGT
jgi:hypothetical protein